MRKVSKGQMYKECGKDREPFEIVGFVNQFGKAKTDRGTLISLDRLRATKHYKPI